MSSLKKRSVTTIIIVAVCLAVLGTIKHFSGINPVASAVKTVFTPLLSGVSYISSKAESGIIFLWEMDEYKERNEELQARVKELELKDKDTARYREENEDLKALLDLQENTNDYTSLAASVIGCSTSGTYSQIEINRGTADGIKTGNSVVSADGIVGTVTDTGLNWATVSTILDEESAVGIRVTRTSGIGVAEGDAKLSAKGLLKLSFIDRNSNVTVGDLLQTSGSGSVYPPGFMVGKVRAVSYDNSGILEYAEIEPSVSFSRLHTVLVINGMEE